MTTITGKKLGEAVELLVDKMIQLKLINPAERQSLVDTVTKALEMAYPNGHVPANLFQDAVQLKKMMSLVVCASIEKNVIGNPLNAHLADMFNTNELAKSMFTPELAPELAKQRIAAFTLALMPPGPCAQKKYDELAELMVRQQLAFNDGQHNEATDNALDALLVAKLAAYQYLQNEFSYIQAFGASPDGSPISVAVPQLGNDIGAQDITATQDDKAGGYLNAENNPNSLSVDPNVKAAIEQREETLGSVFDELGKELTSIMPKSPRPGGPMHG